ncbi:MAG: hybrid sensor histidine kinase/response regulator [Cyanobacteria bacterium J06639_1]
MNQADFNDDELAFAPEDEVSLAEAKSSWKVLVVDDDAMVHQATKVALKLFRFENRDIHFVSAFSEAEAKQLIEANPDTALILLDVVMETPESGLKVVQYIRDTLHNQAVRIVLRTGQPGQAPEESVVIGYDINDYKTKLELTQDKLFTTLVSSLRSYRDLLALERHRLELESLNTELQTFNHTLERQVRDRTLDLAQKNQLLQKEITDREKAEQALQIHVNALTHDLRNPLTGMVNVLNSFISSEIALQSSRSAHAEIPMSVMKRLLAGCDRLLEQINRLVEVAESETRGIQLVRHPFSMVELVRSIAAEWQDRLAQKRVRLALDLDVALPLVDGDRAQLWRVFENLIGNALKHNPPGISLAIAVSPAEQPGWLTCSIADTGVGIDPQVGATLFELYERGTQSRATQGLGLGLYICRRIVEAHGGRISLDSGPGAGTRFQFTVPEAS